MSQDHAHGHSHQHHRHHHIKTVSVVLVLTAIFMVIEILYGYWTNSLALMADGVHMLTDVASLGMTAFAFILSRRPATAQKTFGFYRAEIFAAFINSLLLSVVAIGLIYSAWERLGEPPEVEFKSMSVVATLGLLVNLVSGYWLHKGAKDNINLRGAFLHVMGDAVASVGTIAAAALMWWKGWMMADPLMSIGISVIIFFSAFRLMSETIHLILQGVPLHIDTATIEKELRGLSGVLDVHHLHVWGLSSDLVILTVHLVMAPESDGQKILTLAKKSLREQFHIDHTTIQIETQNLKDQEIGF